MITKIIVFILIVCILNVLKEGFRLGVSFYKNEEYKSSETRTLLTWMSISYILTIIFCGFKI